MKHPAAHVLLSSSQILATPLLHLKGESMRSLVIHPLESSALHKDMKTACQLQVLLALSQGA